MNNNISEHNHNNNPEATQEPPAHTKAIASMVLGIIGICACGACGIVAIILSISAKNEGNDEGMRKAGFVMGIIGVVLWIIGIILFVTTTANNSTYYF